MYRLCIRFSLSTIKSIDYFLDQTFERFMDIADEISKMNGSR